VEAEEGVGVEAVPEAAAVVGGRRSRMRGLLQAGAGQRFDGL
jgi:hypothetical protein